MTLAPGWLQAVSDVNPLKHVVEGAASSSSVGTARRSRGGVPG
jgi:hypothetical protein